MNGTVIYHKNPPLGILVLLFITIRSVNPEVDKPHSEEGHPTQNRLLEISLPIVSPHLSSCAYETTASSTGS